MHDTSQPAPPFLELRQLSKSFGGNPVLEDFTLSLSEGEILALVGRSGSGKTTALRLLAGFEQPDAGSIRIGGEEVTQLNPARRGCGMVFQHYALFPHMTVRDNVAFGLEQRKLERQAIDRRVVEMLELVDLAGFGRRRVSEISGGQQQRVALARALAPEPRVLLLDEPLSNLDPTLRERTRRELRAAVRRVGITTVLVTHEQEEAFHLGDRVALLNQGRLEQVGAPRELYEEPASPFVATFIGRASVLQGRVQAAAGRQLQVDLGSGVTWPAEAAIDGLEPTQQVQLAARPESLTLAAGLPSDAGESQALVGTVRERRYTGHLTYVVVRLADGREVEALVSADQGQEGQTVGLIPSGGAPLRAFAEPGSRP